MIGIFDSGIGGLTVVREVLRLLPGYDTVYFGDTARTPYGNKSPETLRRFALEDAEFLVSRGAKAVVVACNTVSAVAIGHLRSNLSVPVIEVVTPAVEAAARAALRGGPKGRIGLIGTRATVGSGVYGREISRLCPDVRLTSLACPLFVPLVEEGWAGRPEALAVAKRYLSPLKWPKVQTLILGCTHYPFLKTAIRQAVGREVRLIDPARETALYLKRFLADSPGLDRTLGKNGRHRFFVSDCNEHLSRLASSWLRQPVILKSANLKS